MIKQQQNYPQVRRATKCGASAFLQSSVGLLKCRAYLFLLFILCPVALMVLFTVEKNVTLIFYQPNVAVFGLFLQVFVFWFVFFVQLLALYLGGNKNKVERRKVRRLGAVP